MSIVFSNASSKNILIHCVRVNKLNRDVAVGGGKNIQDDLSWQVLLPYRTN